MFIRAGWLLFILFLVLCGTFGTGFAESTYSIRIYAPEKEVIPGSDPELTLGFKSQQNTDITAPFTLKIYHYDEKTIQNQQFPGNPGVEPIINVSDTVSLPADKRDYDKDTVQKKIQLKNVKPGCYFVELKSGRESDYASFQVSLAGMTVKTSPKQLLVFVQDKITGQPLEGYNVLLKIHRKIIPLGSTSKDGLFARQVSTLPLEAIHADYCEVIAGKGSDFSVAAFKIPVEDEELKVYLYTDRPVYRPGQTVYFKGVLRSKKGDDLTPLANENIRYIITDYNDRKLTEKTVKTNIFGGFDGSYTLDKDVSLGVINIDVKNKGEKIDGTSAYVEEYRKPEFEVTVKPDKDCCIQGETVKFHINARYFWGEPVANAKFSFWIQSRSYYYGHQDHNKYKVDEYGERGDIGEGMTDEKGNAIVEVETERVDFDDAYFIDVEVSDAGDRTVRAASSVSACQGKINLELIMEDYVYKINDQAKFCIVTGTRDGKPISAPVTLEISRPVKKHNKEEKEILFKKTVTTDANGKAEIPYRAEILGDLTITASAQDDLENVISKSENISVVEKKYSSVLNERILWIAPGKWSYAQGEIMHLPIINSFGESTGLMTLERDDIYETRILPVRNGVFYVDIPVDKMYAPEVFGTLSYWKDGRYHACIVTLPVDAQHKELKISIASDRETYKPGNPITYSIHTEKFDGTPVSAEVGLGIVDDAIFSVQQNCGFDPQPVFHYGWRRCNVGTWSSDCQGIKEQTEYCNYDRSGSFSIIRLSLSQAQRTDCSPIPCSPPPPTYSPPGVFRYYFPDTAYFNPSVITDTNGDAKVTFTLPDSLTTWRATARGVTVDSETGKAESKVTVKKDVMVRLLTPRFLVQKDVVTISAMVYNYTDKDLDSKVSFKVEGVQLLEPPEKMVSIPAGGNVVINWRVKAEEYGTATFSTEALTRTTSDAITLSIPIHPHGIKKVENKVTSIENSETISKLTIDVNPENKDQVSLTVSMAPSLMSSLVSSLDYLIEYPHGCVEQTMNRFMPCTVVQMTLAEMNPKNPEIEKRLSGIMVACCNRIYDFQESASGGWGWWKNSETDPYITAYVVYGLNLAKKAGRPIDERAIERGAKWLNKNYDQTKDLNTKVYVLYALSEAGNVDPQKAVSLVAKHRNLNSYSRALLVSILAKAGQKEQAVQVLNSLKKDVVETGDMAFWKGTATNSWLDNDIETTAYAVKAFILVEPKHPLVEKAVRYLTLQRQGNRWDSTKSTTAAILALLDYVRVTGEAGADFTATVRLNGEEVKSVHFSKDDIAKGAVTFTIPGEKLASGTNTLEFTKQGSGKLYGSAQLSYYTTSDKFKNDQKGISVKRSYFLVSRELVKVTEKVENSKLERFRYEYKDTLTPFVPGKLKVIKPGDVIEVRVEVTADDDYRYVMIEDMKPAGCEVVDSSVGNYNSWYCASQNRDEKIAFFRTYLDKGVHKFSYRLRGETTGNFRVLPATASLMYSPEISGNSDEDVLEIKK